MLLGNYSVIHKSPGKFLGGIGAICGNNWGKNGQRTAIYTNSTIPAQWGLPVGYSTGWMLPRKSGYVVAFSEMNLTGNGTAVMGVNGDGESFIQLTANADLSLVVSSTGICNIVLTLTGQSVGALYGTGTSEIVLGATGTLGAVAFSTGESNITLTAEADISAIGYMTGEMTPFTELSPENLAKAVWSALANENNDIGTMGAKLNTASSGGVDMDALAQAVWEYGMRSLTESAGLTTEQAEQLERIDTRVDIKVSESVGGGGGGIGFGQIQYIIEEVLKEYDKKPKEKIDENEKEYIMELEKKIDGLYTYIDEVKTKIPGVELGAETLIRIKSLEEFIRKKENKTQEEKEMIKGLKKATKEIIEMIEREEREKEDLTEELKQFITSLI